MRGIAVGLLLLVWASADAWAALPPPMAAVPYPADKTALEVAGTQVAIDCQQAGRFGLDCRIVADYAIHNPTDAAISVGLETHGFQPGAVQLDGGDLPVVDGAQTLTVAAGATARLVTTESIGLRPRRMNMFLAFEPLYIRHLVFGGHSSPGYIPSIELPFPRSRFWGKVAQADYTARYPGSWTELHGNWQHDDGSDRRVATTSASRGGVYFGPKPADDGPVITNGGPYIELGGTFDVGFRGRVGYEVGHRGWLIGSLSVGSDLDEDLIITPVVEAASPSLLFLPSLGAGLGVPVRVRPDLSAGLRIQLVATWAIGFVATFDYWPEDELWRTTLSARIGI